MNWLKLIVSKAAFAIFVLAAFIGARVGRKLERDKLEAEANENMAAAQAEVAAEDIAIAKTPEEELRERALRWGQ